MTGLLNGVAEIAARGFQWWTSELADLLPGRMSSKLPNHQADVTVGIDAKGTFVSLDTAKRGDPSMAAQNGDASEIAEALGRLALARPDAAVQLRLPSTACFERHVDIPASARRQAKSILELDLERSTPFKIADVYVAETYAPAAGRKGWITASQFIVKRKAAEKAIAALDGLGLKTGSIDCWAADGKAPVPVNFLSTASPQPPPYSTRPVLAMCLLAVALSASAAWIAISRREAALAELEREVSVVRVKADAQRQTQSAADETYRAIVAVRAWKVAHISSVEILNELTRLLPDDVTLNDFKREGDTIDIAGLAKSVAAAIPILERSAMFNDALLTAPVTFDAATDRERLILRLKLRRTPKTAALPSAEVPQ